MTLETPVSRPETATWDAVADELGVERRPVPARRWVQSATAGHVGAIVWGGRADVVFVHDLGDSANGFDPVALALRSSAVAVDLPGHGRSSASTATRPGRLVAGLLDAIASLAPSASVVVASGYGAAVVLRAAVRRPGIVRAVAIVDGGPWASGITPLPDVPLGEVTDAVAVLSRRAPSRPTTFHRHLAEETTVAGVDGGLVWRSQVGGLPADVATWPDFADVPGDLPVPVAVLAATTEPVDAYARAALDRWPDIVRLGVDADQPDDLLGVAPRAVARAIAQFRSTLDVDHATAGAPVRVAGATSSELYSEALS